MHVLQEGSVGAECGLNRSLLKIHMEGVALDAAVCQSGFFPEAGCLPAGS
jgi:hypothetical protein